MYDKFTLKRKFSFVGGQTCMTCLVMNLHPSNLYEKQSHRQYLFIVATMGFLLQIHTIDHRDLRFVARQENYPHQKST